MATDPSWLYSTIAQSSAAIVAIIGGFITASVLMLTSEKRNLINQKKDKETRIQTLSSIKENLLKELEPKEILSFLNSIVNELIDSEKMPSLEEILQNYRHAQNFNLKILKKDYEILNKQILEARSFIEKHSDKIIVKEDIPFDEWLNTYHLDTTSYNYAILEKEYNRVLGEKYESLPDWERSILSPSILRMKIPYITPQSEERELENLSDKIKESKTEISALQNDVTSLDTRLRTFSYPPNLGWGIVVLGFLAVFSIFLPVLIISKEVFFTWAKWLTTATFWLGIIGVFAYIVFQIRALRRK